MSYYQYIPTQFIWERLSLTHGGCVTKDIDYNDTSTYLSLCGVF